MFFYLSLCASQSRTESSAKYVNNREIEET
jgi:hypothetical protein